MISLTGDSLSIFVACCVAAVLFVTPVNSYSQENYSFSLEAAGASAFGVEGQINNALLQSRALTVQRVSGNEPVMLTIAEHDQTQDNFVISKLEILSYVDRNETLSSHENVNDFRVEGGTVQVYPAGITMTTSITAEKISVGSPGSYIAFQNVSQILIDSPRGTALYEVVIPQSSRVLIDGEEQTDFADIARVVRLTLESPNASTPIVISGDRIDVFDWQKIEVDSYSFALQSLFTFNAKGTVGIAIPNHTIELNGAGRLQLQNVRADTVIQNNGRSNFDIQSRGFADSVTLNDVDVLSLQREADEPPYLIGLIVPSILAIPAGLAVYILRDRIFAGGFKVSDIQIIKRTSNGKILYNVAAKVTSKHRKVVKDVDAEFQVVGDGKPVDVLFVSEQTDRYGNERTSISAAQDWAGAVGWGEMPDPSKATSGSLDEIRHGESMYLIVPHSSTGVLSLDNPSRSWSNYVLDLKIGQKYTVRLTVRGTDPSGTVAIGKGKNSLTVGK